MVGAAVGAAYVPGCGSLVLVDVQIFCGRQHKLHAIPPEVMMEALILQVNFRHDLHVRLSFNSLQVLYGADVCTIDDSKHHYYDKEHEAVENHVLVNLLLFSGDHPI